MNTKEKDKKLSKKEINKIEDIVTDRLANILIMQMDHKKMLEMYKKLYSISSILRRTILHKRFIKYPIRCCFNLMINLAYRNDIKKEIAPIIV